jgi:hypothetical protein
MNEGDVTTRFLQIWLTPDKRGVKPQYGSKTFEPADRHNRRASWCILTYSACQLSNTDRA